MESEPERKSYLRLLRLLVVTIFTGVLLLLNTYPLGKRSKLISGTGWPFDVPRTPDAIYGFLANFAFCSFLLFAIWYALFWIGQEPHKRLIAVRFRLSTLLLCCVGLGFFLWANLIPQEIHWRPKIFAYGWPLPVQFVDTSEGLSDPDDLPFTLRAGRVGTGHFLNLLTALGACLLLVLILERIHRLFRRRPAPVDIELKP